MTDFTDGEFAENIQRVEHLIGASRRLALLDPEGSKQAKDVLRAAVVFLHSSLEEVIRDLYLVRLPNAAPEDLNSIPFAGHEPSHRPKPVQLGDLKAYSGQFVDNVIINSINRYIDTLNINNSTQLENCLRLASIQTAPIKIHYGLLDGLMKRRHQIVHQMDRLGALDPLASAINDIEEEAVLEWMEALKAFTNQLMQQV